MADQIGNTIYDAVLNRMNITWEPDEKTAKNIKNAIGEARDYLRSVAGNPTLTFGKGEKRNLLITCTWYFLESKRADFIQEYSGELMNLRLEEAFGCGKEGTNEV